jgi:hypothetical protein
LIVVVAPWDLPIESVCISVDETYYETAYLLVDEFEDLADLGAQIDSGRTYYLEEAERNGVSFYEWLGVTPEQYPRRLDGLAPVSEGLADWFERRSVEVVAAVCDLTVHGVIAGIPVRASYSGLGTSHEGATVVGTVTLEADGQEPLVFEVSGSREPPSAVGGVGGARGERDAPFWLASGIAEELEDVVVKSNQRAATPLASNDG